MDVSQLMQGVNACKHLGDVEPCMPVVKYTCVVEKRAEVAAWYVLHGEVNALVVLKCVEKLDQPFTVCRRENVSFRKNVPDFVELEEEFLAHHLERTHFTCIFLLCKVDLTV